MQIKASGVESNALINTLTSKQHKLNLALLATPASADNESTALPAAAAAIINLTPSPSNKSTLLSSSSSINTDKTEDTGDLPPSSLSPINTRRAEDTGMKKFLDQKITELRIALEQLSTLSFIFKNNQVVEESTHVVNAAAYHADARLGKSAATEPYLEARRELELKQQETAHDLQRAKVERERIEIEFRKTQTQLLAQSLVPVFGRSLNLQKPADNNEVANAADLRANSSVLSNTRLRKSTG